MSNKAQFEEKLRKNRPTKILPIINTCFSVALIGLLIFVQLTTPFHIGYFILFLIIFLLFPVASWYNSYFSKKTNTKKIYNYHKETTLLTNYMTRYRNYTTIEINPVHQLLISYELVDKLDLGKVEYQIDNCSFGNPTPKYIMMTIGVGFAGIEINPTNKQMVNIAGLTPPSVWFKKHLNVPIAKKAKAYATFSDFSVTEKTLIQALRREDSYYDSKSGWLCIGERKATPLDEVIQIMENVILVVREQLLISVWIQLDKQLL